MSKESTTTSGGVGFCGLLAIAFIVLKLTHTIGWSWWWVLSPLWIPLGIAVLAGVAYVMLAVIGTIKDRKTPIK